MKNTLWNRRLVRLENSVRNYEEYVVNAERETKEAWETWKKRAENENRLRNKLLGNSNALAAHWAIKDKDDWKGNVDA